ncbi:hypothetical protein M153_11700010037 [Pseudoloma neurophilia]|uniref:Uncharacterized protein n=1 Tax=Pseudoloma neurophilia TaxID=146866 RepID=A0A0R0M737_9MICR|nr:hypothetical protein M153_11700010037 [Pseudoloma neurophilia]
MHHNLSKNCKVRLRLSRSKQNHCKLSESNFDFSGDQYVALLKFGRILTDKPILQDHIGPVNSKFSLPVTNTIDDDIFFQKGINKSLDSTIRDISTHKPSFNFLNLSQDDERIFETIIIVKQNNSYHLICV